jgi:hypothetical protein
LVAVAVAPAPSGFGVAADSGVFGFASDMVCR